MTDTLTAAPSVTWTPSASTRTSATSTPAPASRKVTIDRPRGPQRVPAADRARADRRVRAGSATTPRSAACCSPARATRRSAAAATSRTRATRAATSTTTASPASTCSTSSARSGACRSRSSRSSTATRSAAGTCSTSCATCRSPRENAIFGQVGPRVGSFDAGFGHRAAGAARRRQEGEGDLVPVPPVLGATRRWRWASSTRSCRWRDLEAEGVAVGGRDPRHEPDGDPVPQVGVPRRDRRPRRAPGVRGQRDRPVLHDRRGARGLHARSSRSARPTTASTRAGHEHACVPDAPPQRPRRPPDRVPDLAGRRAARDAAGGRRPAWSSGWAPRSRSGRRSGSTPRSAACSSRCCSRSPRTSPTTCPTSAAAPTPPIGSGPLRVAAAGLVTERQLGDRDRRRHRARRRWSGCGWSTVGGLRCSLGPRRARASSRRSRTRAARSRTATGRWARCSCSCSSACVAVAGRRTSRRCGSTRCSWPRRSRPAPLITAILVVNNLRDIDTDAAAGKRTLAVRHREAPDPGRVRRRCWASRTRCRSSSPRPGCSVRGRAASRGRPGSPSRCRCSR